MYAFKAVVLIIDYCSVKVKYSRQNSCGCRVSSIEEILRIFFFFFSQIHKGEPEAEHVWYHVDRVIMGGQWDLQKSQIR